MFEADKIQYLDKFCKEKGVKYIDVRAEMVDHLAEAIAQRLQDNPDETFAEALNNVYTFFGGQKGFKEIVEAKAIAAEIQAKRIFRNYLYQKFNPEKVLISLVIGIASAVIFEKPYNIDINTGPEIVASFYLVPGIAIVAMQWINSRRDKRWLLLHEFTKIEVLAFLMYYLPSKGLMALINHSIGPAGLWYSLLTILIIYLVLRQHAYFRCYLSISTRYRKDYPGLFSKQ